MKVLITGANGLLGSNLVRKLIEKKHEVSVLLIDEELPTPTINGLPIKRYYGNVLDKSSLFGCFENKDVVIHAAAITSIYPARNNTTNRVNIDGTKNVIEAALKCRIKRLIHVGTANSFYFDSKSLPATEKNNYGAYIYGLDYMDSKRKAQELVLKAVKEQNLPALIVNPTFMIGAYDSKPSSGSMIMAMHSGKVFAYTKGIKNYISVNDAATAIVNAIELGRIGECYILGNHNLTYKEAFETIAKVIGKKPPKIPLSNKMVITFGSLSSLFGKLFKYEPSVTKELSKISCDNHSYCSKKAREELNMPITPFEDAVKDCYNWFIENNYITKK